MQEWIDAIKKNIGSAGGGATTPAGNPPAKEVVSTPGGSAATPAAQNTATPANPTATPTPQAVTSGGSGGKIVYCHIF